jgi:GntP family gluconate:H+ symporter
MGASGAMIRRWCATASRGRCSSRRWTRRRALRFVVFILLGSTTFNLVFQGVDGSRWVEHLLTGLPGGQLGFLIVVNVLVFVLAFFLDFFELAFIIVPLVGPVAEKLGIDLIWFGVLLGVNMQTSFMHPPFGFALFYLRSVAAIEPYKDRVTGQVMAPVTTGQIYWGRRAVRRHSSDHGRTGHCIPGHGQQRSRQGQGCRSRQIPDRDAGPAEAGKQRAEPQRIVQD